MIIKHPDCLRGKVNWRDNGSKKDFINNEIHFKNFHLKENHAYVMITSYSKEGENLFGKQGYLILVLKIVKTSFTDTEQELRKRLSSFLQLKDQEKEP